MNTLQDLNTFSSTAYEFSDNRTAGVTFDRTTPTNGEIVTTQNTTHSVPVGIQILEVINYATAAVTYTINVSAAAGATVTWPTVPTGCTVTNPSTGVYTISGVKSKAIWDIVRSPTVLSPTGVNNDFWQYTATITYNSTLTKSWYVGVYVGTVTVLTTPTNATYTSGGTTSITGEPQIQYPGSVPTWTVTVTPELIDAVTTLSSAGSGGTSTFNSTTKVLTIVGTKTQVNSHLSTISVVSVANNHWTYNLTYVATNATDISTATKTQQLNSTNTTVLLATVSDETYSINQSTTISNGPQINDSAASGFGSYTSTVSALPTTALSLINFENGFQSIFNPDESQKIIPTGAANADFFGFSSAMTSNGNILAVSTPYKDPGGITDAGQVYIYRRNTIYNTTWSFVTTLIASDFATLDYFGGRIAISDGVTSPITLAVGSSGDNNSGGTDAGSVYIFTSTNNGGTWTEQTRLQASDATAGDVFGGSVALSSDGNTLAVGATGDDGAGTNAGSVYIFTRSGSTWTEQTKLGPLGGLDDLVGYDVSLSSNGNILAIGSVAYGTTLAGYVRIYTRSGSTWSYQAQVRGSDSVLADHFGYNISLNSDGTYLAVGADLDDNSIGTDAGSVYIFTRSGSTWTEQTRLQATSFTYYSSMQFGYKVKFNSDATILAVTAISGISGGYGNGSVYIFTRSGSTWTESQVLDASDSGANDNFFGQSITMDSSGTCLAVGCIVEDTSPTTDQGAVYMYTKVAAPSSLTWDSTAKTYTIVGTKYATNAVLNNLIVTPSTGFDTNFNLIYTATTPTPATATRNQRVNKT
jgi:hypothetical protein